MKSIETRFCEYVQIDTQSDPNSSAQPSTEKQKNLSRVLVAELLEMGLEEKRARSLANERSLCSSRIG